MLKDLLAEGNVAVTLTALAIAMVAAPLWCPPAAAPLSLLIGLMLLVRVAIMPNTRALTITRAFRARRSWTEIRPLWTIIQDPTYDAALKERARSRLRHNVRHLSQQALAEMPAPDRRLVYSLIYRSGDEALVRALLGRLVQLRALDSLSSVRALAFGGGELSDRTGARSAAEQAADVLVAMADEQPPSDVLLRPSRAPASGTLLRPANGDTTAPDEQLLRPATHDDQPPA